MALATDPSRAPASPQAGIEHGASRTLYSLLKTEEHSFEDAPSVRARLDSLVKKTCGRELCNKGTALAGPQRPHDQRWASAPAVTPAYKITFSPSCWVVPLKAHKSLGFSPAGKPQFPATHPRRAFVFRSRQRVPRQSTTCFQSPRSGCIQLPLQLHEYPLAPSFKKE